jgi:hypothetical protein
MYFGSEEALEALYETERTQRREREFFEGVILGVLIKRAWRRWRAR